MILLAPLRWLAKNLSTLILAFVLSIVVWVSAVTTADPNEEHLYRPIQLEKIGLDTDLLLSGDLPNQIYLTLQAPRSIWYQINNDPGLVRAWLDLSGLRDGEHVVKVQAYVDTSPVRFIQINPSEVRLKLEKLISQRIPVRLRVNGSLPLGYTKENPVLTPAEIEVKGSAAALAKVQALRAAINISGASETINIAVPVEAVDADGNVVSGVTLGAKTVRVVQPVRLQGGFKNVVVKVVSHGQVAEGYRLDSVSVTPPTVTLFSANPDVINRIPGYVETRPVTLTGLQSDTDMRVDLNLPGQVTLVGDQSVLVQVGVSAIEGSLTISLPVEAHGLPPDLEAQISPGTIDVIVAGPLPVLETLNASSFRAVVDLSEATVGVRQVSPVVDLIPDQVSVQTILPETVEVKISVAPTMTPTPTLPSNLFFDTPTPSATLPARTAARKK